MSSIEPAPIVLPIADDSAEIARRNNFHTKLMAGVEKELRTSDSNMMAYDKAYTRSMKLLEANTHHENKPMLGQLTNVVYRYCDPCTNFREVMDIDSITAVWAGHLFICCHEKVSWLFSVLLCL